MSSNTPKGVLKRLRHRKNKEFWWSKAFRYLHYKLIIPIQREKDSPHLIAYSVMIGLFVGFTPSVGIQMPALFVIWWIAKKIFKFNFSLLIAIAWSWFSNAATMIPLYYLFYATGRLILPTDEDDFSFEDFSSYISSNLSADAGIAESFEFLIDLIELVGSSLLIGSLPWAVGLSLLGYWLSLRATLSYQRFRQERMLKKLHEKSDQ
ncbi:DUF2062 domain-containing protein [Curvivirga sp.]|uniref:DUF2062 domain-containing protein n=1 Tax=Curvivirga sp. TaxID=2856848 RepID=UPI003B599B38